MAYSAPYSYPYPGQFNNVKDGEDYCKRLYAALQDRDARQDYVRDRSTDKDLKELFVRPEWYGAKGDDSTDDSVALQAAINASINDDKPLLIGPKMYVHSATLTLNVSGKAVNMIGFGAQDTTGSAWSGLRYTGTGTAYTLKRDGVLWIYQFRVKGVGFYASAAATIGIDAENISQTYIDDIGFWAHGSGQFSTAFKVSGGSGLYIKHPIFSKGTIGFDLINLSIGHINEIDSFAVNTLFRISGYCYDLHVRDGASELSDYYFLVDDTGPGGAVTIQGLWIENNHWLFNGNQLGYTTANQELLKFNNTSTNSMVVTNLYIAKNYVLSAGAPYCTTTYPINVSLSATTGASTVVEGTISNNRILGFTTGIVTVTNDANKTLWHGRDNYHTGVFVNGTTAADELDGLSGATRLTALFTTTINSLTDTLYIKSSHASGIILQNDVTPIFQISSWGINPGADDTLVSGTDAVRWLHEYAHNLHVGPASTDNAIINEDGSATFDHIHSGQDVVNVATGRAVTAAECAGSIVTNTGASADMELELPAATVGLNVKFYVTVAKKIKLDPNLTDQIMILTGTAGDYLESDAVIGSYIHLVCLVANKWYPLDYAGVWTEEA